MAASLLQAEIDIEVIPETKLAFRVNANNTIWSYELQPTDGGTRVVETRHG